MCLHQLCGHQRYPFLEAPRNVNTTAVATLLAMTFIRPIDAASHHAVFADDPPRVLTQSCRAAQLGESPVPAEGGKEAVGKDAKEIGTFYGAVHALGFSLSRLMQLKVRWCILTRFHACIAAKALLRCRARCVRGVTVCAQNCS